MKQSTPSVYLAIDLVLGALIGPPNAPVESTLLQAERGEVNLILLDTALYCAICSVHEGDNVNFTRFGRLLRHALIQSSRLPGDPGLRTPTTDEIMHWREVALSARPN